MTKEYRAFPESPSVKDNVTLQRLLGELAIDDNVSKADTNSTPVTDKRSMYSRPKHSLGNVTDWSTGKPKPNHGNVPKPQPRVAWEAFVKSVFRAPQLAGGEGTKEQEEQVRAVMQEAVVLARENQQVAIAAGSTTGTATTANSSSAGNISTENWIKVVLNVCRQMGGAFGTLPLHRLDAFSFSYYVQAQDAKKNVSWKRRQHRNMPPVSRETLFGLNDALYLAQASFVNTVEHVKFALSQYKGPRYELVYCLTAAEPYMPAHFLAVRKDDDAAVAEKSSFFSVKDSIDKKPKYLELLLSVRGTKTVDDYFTDMMVETCDYRGGRSHHGISISGLNIYSFLINSLIVRTPSPSSSGSKKFAKILSSVSSPANSRSPLTSSR